MSLHFMLSRTGLFFVMMSSLCGGTLQAEWIKKFEAPPGLRGQVNVVTEYKNNLLVGGWFLLPHSTRYVGVAGWNGTNWFTLGDPVPGPVYAIAKAGDQLYVGGNF